MMQRPTVFSAVCLCGFGSILLALALYQQAFAYSPLIVLFGALAVLSLHAAAGLLALLVALRQPPREGGASVRVFTVGLFCISSTLLLILVGSFVSNSIWGDPLDYLQVLHFGAHPDAVLAPLPYSSGMKIWIVAGGAVATLAVLAVILAFSAACARRAVAGLERWASADPSRLPQRTRLLAAGLSALCLLPGGLCLTLLQVAPQQLEGEPLSRFLLLSELRGLTEIDEVRRRVALEDRASRASYRAPADFERKNVILIVVDSLRSDRMGVYDYPRPTTPFLSGLHEDGTLHRVDVALATCSETYCGVGSMLASRPFHELTLANFKIHELLRDIGYRVRYYLSGDHESWGQIRDFYGEDLDEKYDFLTLDADNLNDDRNVIRALEGTSPFAGQPSFFYFFLMSSHLSGDRLPEHEIFQPAQADNIPLDELWNGITSSGPEGGSSLDAESLTALSNRYDNGVVQSDAMIERIFELLREKDYLRDSIVVITGDHGDGLGERGFFGHSMHLYQEDIGVPLLVYDSGLEASDSPEQARPVYRTSDFATHIDIAPTVLERLGLPIPSGWRGRSLLQEPIDRFTQHQTRRYRMVFGTVERRGDQLHKYLRYGAPEPGDKGELYDLVNDPGERNNLVDSVDPSYLERLNEAVTWRDGQDL